MPDADTVLSVTEGQKESSKSHTHSLQTHVFQSSGKLCVDVTIKLGLCHNSFY